MSQMLDEIEGIIEYVDPFDDDEVLACSLENPDYCEACQ